MTINSKLYALVVNSKSSNLNCTEGSILAWIFEFYRISGFLSKTIAHKDNPLTHKLLATYYQENGRSIGFQITEPDMNIWNRRADLKGMTFRTGLVDNRPFTMRSIDEKKKTVRSDSFALATIQFFLIFLRRK